MEIVARRISSERLLRGSEVPSGADPVRAAGGLVWRASGTSGGIEVLLVHRPRYDDWSFPKGKLEAGETEKECAAREVLEETGMCGRHGMEVESVAYTDAQGRAKRVRYWEMEFVSGDFLANDEVDAIRWLDIESAAEVLSYSTDVAALGSLAACLGESRSG